MNRLLILEVRALVVTIVVVVLSSDDLYSKRSKSIESMKLLVGLLID